MNKKNPRIYLQFFGVFVFFAALLTSAFSASLPSRPTGYVTDAAGVLDADTHGQMETLLTELDQKTSAEVEVVTLESLNGGDINQEANSLFKKWGIGKKDKKNGVLFLISPSDRKMRIEVGYGLEGILPDSRTGRLLDEQVLPFVREGQLSKGILNGTVALAGVIAQDAGVTLSLSPVEQPAGEPLRELTPTEKLMGFLILIFFIYMVIRHPWILLLLMSRGGGSSSGWSGGGFGDGFGGFGGGSSGGGGASRGW